MTDIVVGAGGRVEDKNFDSTFLAAGFAARRSGTVYSEWRDESGGANAKQWRLAAAAGSLVISTVDDANATASDAYVMTRSGNAVTKHEFKVSGSTQATIDTNGYSSAIVTATTEFRGTVLTSNSTDAVAIKTSGGTHVQISNTASTVNQIQMTGRGTGVGPLILMSGSDAGIPFTISTKGTSGFSFYTNNTSTRQFTIGNTTSAVEFLQATGAASGGSPTLSAQGSSSSVDLGLTPKGSGHVRYGTHSAIGAETVTGFITIKDSGGTERKLAVVS